MSTAAWLKQLTFRVIDKIGTRKEAADRLGVSMTELSYWCNQDHDRFIPVDHLVEADALSGHVFLRELAHRSGFELVPLKAAPIDTETAVEASADISKDAGELVHDVLLASPDGINTREARAILAKVGEVRNSCNSLERSLQ